MEHVKKGQVAECPKMTRPQGTFGPERRFLQKETHRPDPAAPAPQPARRLLRPLAVFLCEGCAGNADEMRGVSE